MSEGLLDAEPSRVKGKRGNAHGRPHLGRVDGKPQERGVLLMDLLMEAMDASDGQNTTATHEESLLFNNQMLATEIQFALATESGNEGREFRANREKEKSADERNRTSTSFRTQEPESCASANSATSAFLIFVGQARTLSKTTVPLSQKFTFCPVYADDSSPRESFLQESKSQLAGGASGRNVVNRKTLDSSRY